MESPTPRSFGWRALRNLTLVCLMILVGIFTFLHRGALRNAWFEFRHSHYTNAPLPLPGGPPHVPTARRPPPSTDTAGVLIDSAAGYSFTHRLQDTLEVYDDGGFEIMKSGHYFLGGRIEQMDGYYADRAREIDSLDLFKGFAMSRVSDEYAVDTPEETIPYDVDTLVRFTNPQGVEILELHLTYPRDSTAKHIVYYVNLSSNSLVKGMMIPKDDYGPDSPASLSAARLIVESFQILKSQ